MATRTIWYSYESPSAKAAEKPNAQITKACGRFVLEAISRSKAQSPTWSPNWKMIAFGKLEPMGTGERRYPNGP